MVEILDKILLSENVVENFYYAYKDVDFRTWLTKVLPEIEFCKNENQDNPWHIYNILDHILHSVEEMNKQTIGMDKNIRRMLAYTMLLHDIGKPETKIRRYSKLYKREVDSFFNHNKASKKIADRVLADFDFCNQEINIIKTLIEDHDIFMFITLKEDGNKYHNLLTKKYFSNLVYKLNETYNGEKLMDYLIKVGKADNKAQNPEMTENSLILLNKMEEYLKNYKNNNELEK